MYHFGQRKIFAKIMNEKLVIRVGGGYMLMSEFLQTYGEGEYEKHRQEELRGGNYSGMNQGGSPARKSPTKPTGRSSGYGRSSRGM